MPDHYLVVDLEATCSDNGTITRQDAETIEIGAAIVNITKRRIVGEFCEFVKPKNNPTLTPFCIELTTITQETIDESKPFSNVFEDFLIWMRVVGRPESFTFASWSRWDFDQLGRECEQHAIHFPFESHVNIPAVGKKNAGIISQRRLLKHFGMKFAGTRHRGIDDARNYAVIVVEMLNRGWLP